MDPDPNNFESNKKTGEEHSADYTPYPKIDPKDVAPVQEDFKDVAIGSSQPEPPQNPSLNDHSTEIKGYIYQRHGMVKETQRIMP
ncbi:hypothetical protein H6P81_010857 [Aristolochia fimbriata]|uniref:Uncharacterized protein n=1 Tax=Aristolochia fimbriata TaxID=158543 RepID=A0AAV7EPY6_ARIFI|nr:hypothetical protein H6P81_010857 [Aristolochia fimbriata]